LAIPRITVGGQELVRSLMQEEQDVMFRLRERIRDVDQMSITCPACVVLPDVDAVCIDKLTSMEGLPKFINRILIDQHNRHEGPAAAMGFVKRIRGNPVTEKPRTVVGELFVAPMHGIGANDGELCSKVLDYLGCVLYCVIPNNEQMRLSV
jgi:hypothetical protein